ncbi:hypothetical protein RUM43_009550 [Polyplax serrata]|uniref:Uncharacterized protein n=1 Tax=Polyplax serrata TaxID=468196 RepID=A0AAN8PAX9_POLSC
MKIVQYAVNGSYLEEPEARKKYEEDDDDDDDDDENVKDIRKVERKEDSKIYFAKFKSSEKSTRKFYCTREMLERSGKKKKIFGFGKFDLFNSCQKL